MQPFTFPRFFYLILLISPFGLLSSCQALSDAEQADLLDQLLSADSAEVLAALETIEAAGDLAFTAPLIDLLWANQIGILENAALTDISAVLENMSGDEVEEDWVFLVDWYAKSKHPPPSGYLAWKGRLYGELHPDFSGLFAEPATAEFQLGEVVWGGVAKDGIPSLDYLEQVPISEVRGYTPKDAVFGVSINGEHKAYPLRVMDWHEMANDVVGGVPIALSYCTLCGSAIVYRTDHPVQDEPLVFGSSGLLYRSNKLMFDRKTNTVWNQLTGRPVMGPLVGKVDQLEVLPVVITTKEAWTAQHPDSTILPIDTGFFRDYSSGAAYGEYFARDTVLFPVGEIDDRLSAKEQVYALEIEGATKAYPIKTFAQKPIINDEIDGTAVVLVAASSAVNVHGYSYQLEYITYSVGGEIRAFERGDQTFSLSADGLIVDETGAVWDISEEGLLNPNGEMLDRLGGHVSFWFGWQSFFPETAVYAVGE